MTVVSPPFTVTSWNVNRRKATWDTIQGLGADVVLLQEASKTNLAAASGYRVLPPPSDDWKITNGAGAAATAIAVLNPDLEIEQIPVVGLGEGTSGTIESSHPGQFTVAFTPQFGPSGLYLVSLYGIPDGSLADVSLHRAISDLTPLFKRGSAVLVAGDINTARGYRIGTKWRTAERYQSVFDRFEALGLDCLGPEGDGLEPFGCPCKEGDKCRHVPTFHSSTAGFQFPLDYVFGTYLVRERMDSCSVLMGDPWWNASDHLPVQTVLRYW